MSEQDPTPSAAPSRRHVLRGAAAVGVAGALVGPLAACAGSDTGASGQSGSPTGAGGDRPSGTITQTSEVPLRGGKVVIVDGTKVVVTQPEADTYKAFTAICTHQGCTVNSVEDDLIRCPCHGAEYDAATGFVVREANGVPPGTQAPLASIPIAVEGDTISFA